MVERVLLSAIRRQATAPRLKSYRETDALRFSGERLYDSWFSTGPRLPLERVASCKSARLVYFFVDL